MTATEKPVYEVYALRYAENTGHSSRRSFIRPDPHDVPMPLAYYVWVIRNAERTVVVDVGFSRDASQKRERAYLRHPVEALAAIGVDAATVGDVVLTHLHYDHSGNLGGFPAATFHLQDDEIAFATGRCICHDVIKPGFELEDILETVRHVYAGRVRFHDGKGRIADGITLHRVGGHSAGLQIVRVRTRIGRLVLASDATHFYANITANHPFTAGVSVPEQFDGYRRCIELADGGIDNVVPGHDPEVLRRYPCVDGDPDIVRLDVAPEDRPARQGGAS